MSWLKRSKSKLADPQEEGIILTPPASSRVEVEVHKDANQHAVEKAKIANEHLKELLVNNGFTLKIYLAAGGQSPRTNNRNNR